MATPPTRIVFSGDLGRPETPIIHDPTAVLDGADIVLVESTYGGREHEPEEEAIRLLAEAINVTADSSGVLLIPSFAIGRTQEVVWVMDRLLEAGRIPHVPLYLDSPMASRASDIYRAFPGYYDEETHRLLETGASPLDYPGATVTRTADESKRIRTAPRPMMIVASNGMLTGGRVVHHLRNLIGDPKATILFVGYQGEGTLGSHLQAGATTIKIDGRPTEVRCQVRSISGFSAHADESELLDWLRHFATAAAKASARLHRARRPRGLGGAGAKGHRHGARRPPAGLPRGGRAVSVGGTRAARDPRAIDQLGPCGRRLRHQPDPRRRARPRVARRGARARSGRYASSTSAAVRGMPASPSRPTGRGR